MYDKLEIGFGYSFDKTHLCPWQLACQIDGRLVISRRDRLDQWCTIGVSSDPTSEVCWSRHGTSLYHADQYGQLACHVFDNSDQPIEHRVITPYGWKDNEYHVLRIWPSAQPGQLLCLLFRQTEEDMSVWRISHDGHVKMDVALEGPVDLSADVLIRKGEESLVQSNWGSPGTVSVTQLSNGISEVIRVADDQVFFPSFSPCGRYILFATLKSGGDHKCFVYDVHIKETKFLARGSIAACSPSNSQVAILLCDQEMRLLDLRSKEISHVLSSIPLIDERELPKLANGVPEMESVSPKWSQDGRWLVFSLIRRTKEPVGPIDKLNPILSGKTHRIVVTDYGSFVLDTKGKTLVSMPAFSRTWSWRPTPMLG